MQWLTLVPENSSVQRLTADNRRPVVVRGVAAPAPCPPAPPLRNDERTAPGAREHRHDERRKGDDRRRQQVPVVLDTRCSDERRRRSDAGKAGQPTDRRHHINLYA